MKIGMHRYAIWALLAIIAVIFLTADGLQVINLHPWSVHQWRQSDCFAYCRTYFEKHTGLLEPSTFNLAGKDGRVVSEIPVIYYLGAQICRVIGFQFWVFRGLTFLTFVFGVVYLYKCILKWIRNPWLAMVPVILVATTPYYYYYALNYLPNVPAISLSFIGLFFMLEYDESGKVKHIVAGTFWTVIAVLLKPTDGGIICVAYGLTQGLLWISKRETWKKLIPLALSTFTVLLSIYVWYKYVEWYNNENGNHKNLQGLYPMWDMTKKEIAYVFTERINKVWLPAYQDISILYILKACFLIYAITWAWQKPFLRLFCFFLVCLTWGYNICWFMAFSNHDYYQLIDVIPIVFLLVAVLECYERNAAIHWHKFVNWGIITACFVIGGMSWQHNCQVQYSRNRKPENILVTPLIYEVEPYLRAIGVKKSDIILSLPDPSTNITLAAFGNQGYTTIDDTDIDQYRKIGVKYLVVNDTSWLSHAKIKPYTTKVVGVYKSSIFVFDIR